MKLINKIKIFSAASLAAMLLFTSCNKVDTAAVPATIDTATTGNTLSATLAASADDSLFNRMVIRGGMQTILNTRTNRYTLFVPNNAAMRAFVNAASSGAVPIAAPDAIHSAFIANTLPATTAASIVSYNILPQKVTSSSFSTTFPNLQYASILNPIPPPVPAAQQLVRLTDHLSKRSNGAWINNVPLTATDINAANGVIHKTAAVNTPPQRAMWERINTDADLTILKAGIQRADSGVTATSSASLIWVLSNFGPNVTLYAPNNAAMKAAINFLSGGLIPIAAPDATFIGFLGSNNVTTQMIKGIVVYHMMGYRVFSVNLPTTATSYPTLLNGAIAAHPGVTVQATFTGPVVSAATIKGLMNPTASNILINPTPDALPSYGATPPAPFTYTGTSDQHYINGTLHKINQVLLPQ